MSEAECPEPVAHGAGAPAGAPSWFAERAVEPLIDLNRHCMMLLAGLARSSAAASTALPPIVTELRDLWCAQDGASLQRHALYPCSLVDAGFADSSRWQSLQKGVVNDSLRPSPGCFDQAEHQRFVHRVLVYGWHLARAHRQTARIVLGMTPQSAQSIAMLRLEDLDLIAERHPGWVRPRWEAQPRIWRQILGRPATGQGSGGFASLRGLQLLAAGTLGPR